MLHHSGPFTRVIGTVTWFAQVKKLRAHQAILRARQRPYFSSYLICCPFGLVNSDSHLQSILQSAQLKRGRVGSRLRVCGQLYTNLFHPWRSVQGESHGVKKIFGREFNNLTFASVSPKVLPSSKIGENQVFDSQHCKSPPNFGAPCHRFPRHQQKSPWLLLI